MGIIYDKELRDLRPPLSNAEYEALENSIREAGFDGRIGKIIFWKCGNDEIIIDGYNRIDICKRLKVKIGKENKQYIDFRDRNDAKEYIIRSHYTRCNMVNICQED